MKKSIIILLLLFGVFAQAQNKKWTLKECVQYALDNNIERLTEDHKRAKEIGIRKVLGASISTVMKMLTKDFFLLIGLHSRIITKSPLLDSFLGS